MRTNRKSEVPSTTQQRMTVVYLLMMLLGIACLVKILYLSIFERAVASGTSDKCVDTTEPGWEDKVMDDTYCFVRENMLRPVRGEIYDDHGRVLVANFTVFEVAFDGKGFARNYADTLKKNPKAYDEIFRQLADDFEAQFKDRYPKYNADYYYQFITGNIQKKRYATLFAVKEWDDRTWVTGADTAFGAEAHPAHPLQLCARQCAHQPVRGDGQAYARGRDPRAPVRSGTFDERHPGWCAGQ